MAVLFDPHFQAAAANGRPESGARLFFYRAGTSSLIPIYKDSAATTPHTNPVIADVSGLFPPIFLAQVAPFKIVLQNAAGITVQTIDRIPVGEVIDLATIAQATEQVEALFASFDTRYLGAKGSDPLVDNSGGPLIDGALYWNTTAKAFRAYDLASGKWHSTAQTYRGPWGDAVGYFMNDLVESGGSIWLAKRSSTGVAPVEGGDWTLFLPGVTVADGSVVEMKLATGSVSSRALAGSSVTLDKLGEDTSGALRRVLAKYRKSVALNLPIRGPHYTAILAATGLAFVIPQAFTVDWQAGHLYLNLSGDAVVGKLWVQVHDFHTGAHIVTFATPCAGQSYSEGIVIKYEGGVRKLYMQTAVGELGRFDLSVFPSSMATLSPEATFPVGLHSQFDYRNGQWLIQQAGPTVGAETRRNNYALYDDALTQRTGTVLISNSDAGPWTASALVNYVPKIQTTSLGDGFLLAACGGFDQRDGSSIPYSYQGVKLFSSDGQLLDENLAEPDRMAAIIEASGFPVGKLEYEGAILSPEGRIYSLCMTLSPDAAGADTSGILIFEEFSARPDFIDFLPAGKIYPKVDIARISSGIWPRSPDGKVHNPWTGAQLTTWDEIMDMMRAMDVPRFAYYTSASTTVVGMGAEVLPGGCLVEILSGDNQTFVVDVSGFGFARKYTAFGSPGSRGIRRRQHQLNAQSGVSAAQAIAGHTWTFGDQGSYLDIANMTADGSLTLSPANCYNGDVVRIKRRGGAFNLVVKDGAGATITTLAANQAGEFMMGGSQFYLWDKHAVL